MKKGSQGNKGKAATKPKSNTVVASKLLKGVQDGIAKQLSTGKMTINPVAKSFPKPNNIQALRLSNPQEYFCSLQNNLKAIRDSIDDQRRVQREEQKQKLAKAQELIDRMRRQREEHQQKLRENSQKDILHRRLYSETTLNQMRQKLEERIVNKRMQIEERVKAIQERKIKRDESVVNKEVQYWQHRKELKQKAKSTSKLPTIKPHNESQAHIVDPNQPLFPPIARKASLSLLAVKAQQYEKQAGRMMRLAKMKQQNIKLRQFQDNYSSRLSGIVQGLGGKPSIKSSQLIPSYADNRQKIMGNEFLKESLLMVRKNSSYIAASSEPQEVNVSNEGPEMVGHQALINANAQLEALREKWTRMLSKIRHGEIGKEQGLQLLNSIEKRLDKVDLPGVKDRLKLKYEVFSGEMPLNVSLTKVEIKNLESPKPK